jgi:hypothetical protein
MGVDAPRPPPYVGPRAFIAGEPLYGRERELADLVDLVIAERVVLLYAPSGAGKSSLLQAGLAAAAGRGGVRGPAGGAAANRFVLSVLLSLEEDVAADSAAVAGGARGATTLAAYLERRMRRRGGRRRGVISSTSLKRC